MKTPSLKKNAILNVIRSVLNVIFPFISFPYSSRILMPDGIGKVRFAQSIVGYFSFIASLGISAYAVRECVKRKDNKEELDKFCQEIFCIYCISTFIAFSLLTVSVVFVPKLREIALLIFICSLTILFNTFSLDWLFTAFEEFTYTTIRSICLQILTLVLLFILVKTKDDYLKYAALLAISAGGQGLSNFFYRRKFVSLRPKGKLELKKHIKPIFLFFTIVIISKIYGNLDVSMLGFLSNETQVGYYSVSGTIHGILKGLIIAITTVIFPRLSHYASLEDKSKYTELFYKGFSLILFLSIPSCVGLTLLSRNFVLLFVGENYLPAVTTINITNAILIVNTISSMMNTSFFVAFGKEKVVILSVAIGSAVNCILNFILIPMFGANGAAISTIVSETCVTLTHLIIASKTISFKPLLNDFLEYIFATLAMSAVVVFVCQIIKNCYLQAIISVIAGSIFYGLMLLSLRNNIAKTLVRTVFRVK